MSNNKPIAGINAFKHPFKVPVGSLILPNTVQPGNWIGGQVGSSTGYVKVHYWDGSIQMIGDGTPNILAYFSKRVSDSDTYEDRTFAVYSCDVDGKPSGDLVAVSLSDQAYGDIDFSPLTNLESLALYGLPSITSIDLKSFSSLKRIDINLYNNYLVQSIDVSGLVNLKTLILSSIPSLSLLNTSGLTGLEYLVIQDIPESLTVLNTADFSSIKEVSIAWCRGIQSLDLSSLSSITNLAVASCHLLTSLNITGLSNLTSLSINNLNSINSIDFTGMTSLQTLYFGDMYVSDLDFTGLISLRSIYLWTLPYLDPTDIDNLLSELDANGVSNGYFTDGGVSRTVASNTNFSNLVNKGWSLQLPQIPLQAPGARLTISVVDGSNYVNGYVASSTGYTKVVYWDGSSQIIGNGDVFSKNNENLPDSQFYFNKSTQDSYSNKRVVISSCTSYGFPSGDILAFVSYDSSSYENVDFSNLDKLQYLRFYTNSHVTSLDLTTCSDLYYFGIDYLYALTSVNLSGLTNLRQIFSTNNNLLNTFNLTGSSILPRTQNEIQNNYAAQYSCVYVKNNPNLNSIDLTGFDNLDTLHIENMSISSLNNSLPYVRNFEIINTSITSVNLSNCVNIHQVWIQNNSALTSVNLANTCTNWNNGSVYIFGSSQLTSINLSGAGYTYLSIYNNDLIDPDDIDTILAALDSKGRTNGYFNDGNIERTVSSNTNYTNLINRGWSLQIPSTPILAPGAILTIPTNLQPGESFSNFLPLIGTNTRYFKVEYWDGTSEIKSTAGVPDSTFANNNSFNKVVDGNDNYTDRTIRVYSCTSTGRRSGDIISLVLPCDKVKSDFEFSGLTKLKYLYLTNVSNNNGVNLHNNSVSFNLSGLNLLEECSIQRFDLITSLNFSSMINLKFLNISNNRSLNSINVTGLTNLNTFNVSLNGDTARNVSIVGLNTLNNLTYLGLVNIKIGSLNLSTFNKLTGLTLQYLDITSLNVSNLTDLQQINLVYNNITNAVNLSGLTKLTNLYIYSDYDTSSDMDNLLSLLDSNGKQGGVLVDYTTRRTTASSQAYDNLISKGWTLMISSDVIQDLRGYISIPTKLQPGESLVTPPSQLNLVGTSTGYFKVVYWDGTSEVKGNGSAFNILAGSWNYSSFNKTVDLNDTFTDRTIKIYSSTSNGTPTGYITAMNFSSNQEKMGDFDISALKKLQFMNFGQNKSLTSINASQLSDLSWLIVDAGYEWQVDKGVLSSVNISGLVNMSYLQIFAPLLTSINSTGANLDMLNINCPSLTSFDTSGFSRLLQMNIQKVTFPIDITIFTKLVTLTLQNSTSGLLTSLNFTNLINLESLYLYQLSDINSLDLSHLTKLRNLSIYTMRGLDPTTINVTGLSKLTNLGVDNNGNWMSNQEIDNLLIELDGNGATNGYFFSGNVQRTSLSSDAYTNLINKGWTLNIPTAVIPSPTGHLTIPTNLKPGDTFGKGYWDEDTCYIGTSTGYFKVEYWDGTSEVFTTYLFGYSFYTQTHYDHYTNLPGTNTPKDGYMKFSKTVAADDTYTDRTINVYSCLSSGAYAGSITYLSLSDCRLIKDGIKDSIKNLKKLQYLSLQSAPNITSIDLSGFNDLWYSYLAVETHMYVKSNNSLNYVGRVDTSLASVNVSGLPNLKNLNVSGADLMSSLDLSGLPKLEGLSLCNNKLMTSIDFSNCTNVIALSVQDGQVPGGLSMSFVGFTAMTKLEYLTLAYTKMTSLNLSAFNNLKYLQLQGIYGLTSVDFSNLLKLNYLYITDCYALSSVPSLSGLNDLTNLTLYVNSPWTPSDIDNALKKLDSSGKINGYFTTGMQRTTLSTLAYNSLISKGWTLQMPSTVIQAPEGFISIPTTLQPGDSVTDKIQFGSSTGFLKFEYWDGTSEIVGASNNVYTVDNNWQMTSTKVVSANDTYTNRTINVYSCLSNGDKAGYIASVYSASDKIGNFDISGMKKLYRIFILNNPTISTSFNLTSFTNLYSINLISCPLVPFINVSGLGGLYDLSLINTSLVPSINLAGCSGLNNLTLVGLTLVSILDVSMLVNLTNLSLVNLANSFSTLDLSNMQNLNNITLVGLRLVTSLSLTNKIMNITLVSIGISSLDVSNMTNMNSLTIISCQSLTSFGSLLGLTKITYLNLVDLPLITSINVTGLTKLSGMNYNSNPLLRNVNGIALTILKWVSTNVLISASEIDDLLTELDNNGVVNGHVDYYVKSGVVRSSASDTAYTNLINKGWTIVINS
jgi:hypothetical protein